ncbi:hypothetical protein R1T16_02420 [Flavobacterium sp. DG1-102-2]|uniref:hypothetical protein n=1 Tax=Flavobacterium sp. DG1-102-2 TaxID=3081663 RepID=UPI002949FAF3|nr:hypothetical protein [Flavobacterium sp. DG1-102-2]MDV6167262.1 hypothetical protein [Flavobacterium sp. DG1-102-2]
MNYFIALNKNIIPKFIFVTNLFKVMKTIFLIVTLFFALTLTAQENERSDKQPPPITQAQVEKDAAMAQQERQKHEQEKINAAKDKKQKIETKQTTPVLNSTSPSKKTSTRPGKQ